MRKYFLTTLVTTIAAITGQADGFRPLVILNDAPEMVSESPDAEIQKYREHLGALSKNDSLVLERFDQFAQSLDALYREEHALTWEQFTKILSALDFAAEKHQFQTRKNKAETPYISHPIGVANNLMTIGEVKDPAVIIAALLHDTVEDTQTTLDEISERFGNEVSGYVNEVSDDKSLSKEQRKRLQVINASHKSTGAAQIKFADKLYNLTDLVNNTPEGWSRARIDQYFEWAESVVNRLPACNPELKQAVSQVINQYWESQDKSAAKK
ncbi:MAG: HD domain-containing protein [Parachlamydiales bacterium]